MLTPVCNSNSCSIKQPNTDMKSFFYGNWGKSFILATDSTEWWWWIAERRRFMQVCVSCVIGQDKRRKVRFLKWNLVIELASPMPFSESNWFLLLASFSILLYMPVDYVRQTYAPIKSSFVLFRFFFVSFIFLCFSDQLALKSGIYWMFYSAFCSYSYKATLKWFYYRIQCVCARFIVLQSS